MLLENLALLVLEELVLEFPLIPQLPLMDRQEDQEVTDRQEDLQMADHQLEGRLMVDHPQADQLMGEQLTEERPQTHLLVEDRQEDQQEDLQEVVAPHQAIFASSPTLSKWATLINCFPGQQKASSRVLLFPATQLKTTTTSC